jgi:hypothetical protein
VLVNPPLQKGQGYEWESDGCGWIGGEADETVEETIPHPSLKKMLCTDV